MDVTFERVLLPEKIDTHKIIKITTNLYITNTFLASLEI